MQNQKLAAATNEKCYATFNQRFLSVCNNDSHFGKMKKMNSKVKECANFCKM